MHRRLTIIVQFISNKKVCSKLPRLQNSKVISWY